MSSKPIRILQYIGSLNSGGSQSMIMNIYRKIDKSKIQFDFVVDRKGELLYKSEIEKLGGKVFELECNYKLLNFLKYKKQWNTFFQSHSEYKIIHCHVRSVASIVLKIAKKYKLKTICHSHGASNGSGLKAIIKMILQNNIPYYSDYLLACSKEAGIWLYGEKFTNSSKFIVVNNGIDFDRFKFNKENRNIIRSKLNVNENEVLIGHVGRFDPIKNHDFILDIANNLVKNKENKYRFVLCGDGPLKEKIKKDITNKNLDRYFNIIDTTNDINMYYSAFDIFVLPSKHEGLGIVLIEAQINGLKCLVSETVPIEAAISNGFIQMKLNLIDWSNYISNSIDFKDRKVILNDYAKKFDVNESCKTLIDIYNKLIK